MISPIELLEQAVAGYEPYLLPSGHLIDPVLGEPTQYGTAYHALCHAVLATRGNPERRTHHRDCMRRGFEAALSHVANPSERPYVAEVERVTGTCMRLNHRDFFWPPLLTMARLSEALDVPELAVWRARLAEVDILAAFLERPPSNWAMVWLAGEWQRVRAKLSPFDIQQLDTWLGVFFGGHVLLPQGLYQEPGHPNSYDLFTRYHMADMLLGGYDGAWRAPMETLMETGLARSLAVQLSDGSLASAHRSTGQTWTLGAQCAYFTHAANYFEARAAQGGSQGRDATARAAALARQARAARARAFASLVRWMRPDGLFSPVENLLPPGYRVGYETYTADGHYANLALGFLAMAITHGFTEADPSELAEPRMSTRIEGDPTYRAIAHHGPYSVHGNGWPALDYDGFGIVDLTVGLGRRLQLVSSARHQATGRLFNLGMALRAQPGRSALEVLAQADLRLVGEIRPAAGAPRAGAGAAPGLSPGFSMTARVRGQPYTYELSARIDDSGVHLVDSTPGHRCYKSLLIPYVRDGGWSETTRVRRDGNAICLELGREVITITIAEAIESVLDLPHGYESRRGLCGLVRVDLAGELEAIHYRVAAEPS